MCYRPKLLICQIWQNFRHILAGKARRIGLVLLMLVLAGVFAFNLPDATLVQYHLDRDVLLPMVCAMLLVASVYQLIIS